MKYRIVHKPINGTVPYMVERWVDSAGGGYWFADHCLPSEQAAREYCQQQLAASKKPERVIAEFTDEPAEPRVTA